MTPLERAERIDALLNFLQGTLAAGDNPDTLLRMLEQEVARLRAQFPPMVPPSGPTIIDHDPAPAA